MERNWRDRVLYPLLGIISITSLLYFHFNDQLNFPILWQPSMGFVGANSTHFVVAGDSGTNFSALYVNGWNSYWLMEKSIWASSRSKVSKMLKMGSEMGLTVCRTWAFSDGDGPSALQISPGVFNERVFRALDYVIVEARKNRVRLILSLVNNLNAYGGKDQYVRWAQEAGVSNVSSSDDSFFSHPTVKYFYKAYIKAILTRKNSLSGVKYFEEPAIFAWELINEPRCSSHSCAPVLQAWIAEMAAYVKSLDNKHLVTVGLEGFYSLKTTEKSAVNPGEWAAKLGSDFVQNSAIDNIDFASVHAYPDSWIQQGDVEAKAKFLSHWVDSHIKDGELLLKKPVLFTEVGSSLRVNSKIEYVNVLLKTVYDRIYESAKKRQAGAGALIWQLLVEGVEEYSDQFSLVAWDYPSTYELIKKQSCRLRRVFSIDKNIGENSEDHC